MRGSTLGVEIEDDTLAGPEHSEHGASQGVGGQIHLAEVGVPHDDPIPRPWVVRFDNALHSVALPPFGGGETDGQEIVKWILPP
jgi:hypothetical protein